MAVDTETLLRHIEEAFGRMTYPGDEHIVDDRDGGLYSAYPKRALTGRHWRDVTFDLMADLRSGVSSLTPEGFRFYLPGLMVLTIEDIEEADTVPDSVISDLTLPLESDLDAMRETEDEEIEGVDDIDPEIIEWLLRAQEEDFRSGNAERRFFERVSGFDHAQRIVIREFLEYLQAVYPWWFEDRAPAIAVERYWYQFADEDPGRSHREM